MHQAFTQRKLVSHAMAIKKNPGVLEKCLTFSSCSDLWSVQLFTSWYPLYYLKPVKFSSFLSAVKIFYCVK